MENMSHSHPLTTHLLQGASTTGRQAIDVAISGDKNAVADALMKAGVSLELMLKALVCSVSPGLLLTHTGEEKRAEAMMKLQMSESLDLEWLSSQRSASYFFVRSAATTRAPALAPLQLVMDGVIDARNAASHMYLSRPSTLRDHITTLGRVGEIVLQELNIDRDQFWGQPRREFLLSLSEENASAVRKSVAAKLAEAANQLERRMAGLSESEQIAVVKVLENQISLFRNVGMSVYITECPACRHTAEVWVESADYSVDSPEPAGYDRDGIPVGFLVPQVAVAAELKCPVCTLHLTSEEISYAYPELVDLWEVEPRVMSLEEYEDNIREPDPDFY
jgi:hypothetical protein